jgi:hypothetical protein
MTRGCVGLVALLALVAQGTGVPAHAQVPAQTAAAVAALDVEDVVERILSFDGDRDGSIAKHELAERMYGLMDRGDADGNGVLDRAELRALARTPARPSPPFGNQLAFGAGSYGFVDDSSFSTSSHLDGALDDLRLGAARRQQALAIAGPFVETLRSRATADLLDAVDDLLTAAQLAEFEAAVQAQISGRPQAPAMVVTQHGTVATQTIDGRAVLATIRTLRGGGALEGHLERFTLPAPAREHALAAVDRFNLTLRLGGPERLELLAQLQGVLDEEERENLGAALARRPVVQQASVVRFSDVVRVVRPQSGVSTAILDENAARTFRIVTGDRVEIIDTETPR